MSGLENPVPASLFAITERRSNCIKRVSTARKDGLEALLRDADSATLTVARRSGYNPRFGGLALLPLSYPFAPSLGGIIMKKLAVWISALLLAIGLGLLVPGPASAASYCGLSWGSLAKAGADTGSAATLTNVRAGQHYCYDRMVVDLSGPAEGFSVRYVPNIVADGSGAIVPTAGGARLQVTIFAPSYDNAGNPTYSFDDSISLVGVGGYQTFRQIVWANSFEGYTNLGLGVRARLPFRVLTLDGPAGGSRLVVDVAHFW